MDISGEVSGTNQMLRLLRCVQGGYSSCLQQNLHIHSLSSPVLRYAPTSVRKILKRKSALAGNRTRASRVAGENSTTEPPMPLEKHGLFTRTYTICLCSVPQSESVTASEAELRELKESLADTPPVGALLKCARTLDQVRSMHRHKYLNVSYYKL